VRALVQRVTSASVAIAGDVVGSIGPGLCVFVGVTHDDNAAVAARLASKVANLRIFAGENSLIDAGGAALVVSQFTLYGDTSRGRRPSWIAAARPEVAEPLVESFGDSLKELGVLLATGRFRADMQVTLVNDGPVTLLLEVSRG
jgi:D-aminoacyl-tRNA deacylase